MLVPLHRLTRTDMLRMKLAELERENLALEDELSFFRGDESSAPEVPCIRRALRLNARNREAIERELGII